MRKILRLPIATLALLCFAAWPATADPIAITSGMINLPRIFAGGPMMLLGTDGVRSFHFDGVLSGGDVDLELWSCSPCSPTQTEISVGFRATSAILGTVMYGDETYLTDGGFSELKGSLPLAVMGTGPVPPPPTAVGITTTFMVPFTAAGRLNSPFGSGGLNNSILGSGMVAVTLVGDPGNGHQPAWQFQSAQYQFGEQAPTPEPTSVLLLATGLAGLALKRRYPVRTISD